MSHSYKEYLPIVFSSLQIQTPLQNENDLIEEKFPIIQSTNNSQSKKIKTLSISKNNLELLRQKNVKPVVFPNILQKTKEDMRKYRQLQLMLIYNDPNQKEQQQTQNTSINKLHSQSPIKIIPKSNNISIVKPIRTDLSTLMNETNIEQSSNDTLLKFHKLSPVFNESRWQKINKGNRLNMAYEIQKEINFYEQLNTFWKTDLIYKYLHKKIVQHNGLNIKKGCRQVFMIVNLPHNSISNNNQNNQKQNVQQYQHHILIYYIPVYEKVTSNQELKNDLYVWVNYFLQLLHQKQALQKAKIYTLDGQALSSLNIPEYENFIYCSLSGQFDIWQILGNNLNINGQFQKEKYVKLAIKLMSLKQRNDAQLFFSKKENFLPYFQSKKDSDSNNDNTLQNSPLNVCQIEQIDQDGDEINLDEDILDQSIFQMNQKQQSTYIKTIQHFISRNKQKFSQNLSNQEEQMRSRKQFIKEQRRKSVENQLRIPKRRLSVQDSEDYEAKLLNSETFLSMEEIKDNAADQVNGIESAIFKKKLKLKEFNNDPFQSFSSQDNKKFKEIFKLVNIEQIVLEKKVSRQDVLHFLSLFKALMDSDNKSSFTVHQLDYPSLYISRKQLKKSLPYIVLYNNKLNTGKLNEIYDRKYDYVEFLEFLDIFTTEYIVSQKELERLKHESLTQE